MDEPRRGERGQTGPEGERGKAGKPGPNLWYALAAMGASMLLMTGTAVVVSSQAAAESERKWCSLITTMDEAYSVTPPTTEIGRKLARDIKALRVGFDCP